VSLAFRLPGSPRPKPLAPRGMKMSNAEPLAVEVADANKLAAVPNHIDGHDTTSSRRLRQRRGWPLEGETVTLSSQAYRPASASGEGEPHGGVEGVKLPPPIRGYKWCPNHLEAIRLNYAGICPVCMVAPGPFLICAANRLTSCSRSTGACPRPSPSRQAGAAGTSTSNTPACRFGRVLESSVRDSTSVVMEATSSRPQPHGNVSALGGIPR
jgi:hypothetical protein